MALFTIIIPAYNEALRIKPTLDEVIQDFPTAEIIVVDDGSTDGTGDIARDSKVKVVRIDKNSGKGMALRVGFKKASGDVIGFIDADGSTNIQDVHHIFSLAEKHPLVVGSRKMPDSHVVVKQSLSRTIASYILRLLGKLILNITVNDTLCGCKAFNKSALTKILPHLSTCGYDIDLEILYLAGKLKYGVLEVPITWTDKKASTVSLPFDGLNVFLSLIKIRLKHYDLNISSDTANIGSSG